jgi:hypothetical protein
LIHLLPTFFKSEVDFACFLARIEKIEVADEIAPETRYGGSVRAHSVTAADPAHPKTTKPVTL